MRAFLTAAVAACVLAAPALAQTPLSGWRPYVYPDLGYSAELPAEPVRDDIPQGPHTPPSTVVVVEHQSRAYAITTGDYSNKGGQVVEPNVMVDSAVASNTKGRTILSQSSLDVPGGVGREVTSRDGTSIVRARIYWRALKLHVVMVMVTDPQHPELVQDAASTRFFQAFTLLSR